MNTVSLREFAIRDAADGDGQTIYGTAVPYGEPVRGRTAEYGDAIESFEVGSLRDFIAATQRGERYPVVDVHDGAVVAYVDDLHDEGSELKYSGRLLNSQAARDFAERVAAKVMHLSLEFLPGEVKRGRNSVTHTRVAALGAIAGSYFPAYAGTSIAVRSIGGSDVADETQDEAAVALPAPPAPVTVTEQDVSAIAWKIADDVARKYAARNAFGAAQEPDDFAEWRGLSLGQMAQRAIGAGEYKGREVKRDDRLWLKRTIADIVTTAGANAGAISPGITQEVFGIVSRGRPAITAFGGPRAIPAELGMSVDWPYYDGTLSSLVGAQSAQKAEITSVAVDIKKGTEPLLTFAGGADIAYQLLRRATIPYLDTYVRILLTAWGIVTDAAFVAELETGSVTSDFTEALATVDATEFKDLTIDASIAVQSATGIPAEFVLASTTAFTRFAKLFTPITTLTNSGLGTIDLRSLTVNVGGLPVIHVPSITAGKLIVSNREAAAWYEDGPFQAQDEDVMHLGRDVAIWSMGAGARFVPAGIVEMYDVTP